MWEKQLLACIMQSRSVTMTTDTIVFDGRREVKLSRSPYTARVSQTVGGLSRLTLQRTVHESLLNRANDLGPKCA